LRPHLPDWTMDECNPQDKGARQARLQSRQRGVPLRRTLLTILLAGHSSLVAACLGNDGAELTSVTSGLTISLSPQPGDGSCQDRYKFNDVPLKGVPTADWCQIQAAVDEAKAAGGGTVYLVAGEQPFRLRGPVMLNADDVAIVGVDAPGQKTVIDFD